MKREDYKEQYELSNTNVNPLIDRIFDDFESRTCANCKEYIKINNSQGKCNFIEKLTLIDSDFGCNIWKSK